jgi:hypothetical protein
VRADAARADRRAAVRAAADGWRRAGAIDESALRAIVAAYADDRVRLGLGFRILAGLAAFVGACALASLVASLLGGGAVTPIAFGLTLIFASATEIQMGRLRRAQAGAEYATAILASICAAIAWVSLVGDTFAYDAVAIGAVCGLAAWRWGYALFAAAAAVSYLVSTTESEMGRAVWAATGVAAFPLILRLASSARWAPAHRRCFEAAGLVFLAGAYVAINIYSLDHRWIEGFGRGASTSPAAWSRAAAIAGTTLMPPLVVFVGARFRDRSLLAAGALLIAASLITFRQYHPIGPWWFTLVSAGAACLALAVGLRRWLDAGPRRERWGFTADPLFEDRRRVEMAQAAATIVAMSPAARAAPESSFEGGGGRSGGGGATGGA